MNFPMKVGFELADARRRMGLTLEEISRRTKISVERLSAIERGERDNLPALVYLNGFLRAYAAEVNLDGQDVTHRYLEELEQTQFGGASDAPAVDEGGPILELPITERSLEEFVSEDVFHVQPVLSDLPHQSARREAELANEMASQRKSVPSPAFPESKLLLRDVADLNESEDVVEPVAHAASVPSTHLNLGYRVQLQQRGDRVIGTGHKWMEDGKPLPANRRTPIVLEGTRTGQRLELTFTEKGARRVSQGTFVMELTVDGVLQGRFISDAANSQGSSLARRTTPPTH
jgi:transcriptional regulator with XRE-family HTH domain